MEIKDQLIIKYFSEGLKSRELPDHIMTEHQIKISDSYIEKRLFAMRKEHGAKTLFQLAVILKEKKII